MLCWFLEDTRMSALAMDNPIAVSTVYAYRDEGVAVLAAGRPSLHGALLAAKTAGHSHVIVAGTLMHTDRISTPGPTTGVDLWWRGKHHCHGGNIQVASTPDGWSLWTSEVRPGREHDMSAARADPQLLAAITDWVNDGAPGADRPGLRRRARDLHDPGQEGERRTTHHRTAGLQRCSRRSAASTDAPTSCSRPPTRPYAATATALAPQLHRRSRTDPAPPRTRTHYMINND